MAILSIRRRIVVAVPISHCTNGKTTLIGCLLRFSNVQQATFAHANEEITILLIDQRFASTVSLIQRLDVVNLAAVPMRATCHRRVHVDISAGVVYAAAYCIIVLAR